MGAESISLFSENCKILKIVFKKVKYLGKNVLFLAIGVHEGLILPGVLVFKFNFALQLHLKNTQKGPLYFQCFFI